MRATWWVAVLPLAALGCGARTSVPESGARPVASAAPPPAAQRPVTLADDLAFLQAHGDVIVLGGRVVVSPLYQGRVMTSGIGEKGRSFGWIHRAFIEAGKTGTQFDNYGGEDRFWLGPEGGQYGLYFPPGKPFTFDHWQTPHALQEGAWAVAERADDHVVFKKSLTVTNWSGTELSLDVERTVRLLGRVDVEKLLGTAWEAHYGDHVGFVAYETRNRIVNTGKAPWTKDRGLLSVWILSMYAPARGTRVVVPLETNDQSGEIVNDRYFGKVPAERLHVNRDGGYLTFTCDGKLRSKIGVTAERAKDRLGSVSEDGLLTVVQYDTRRAGAPYVNSMWERQSEPYRGDAINSYNDGPPAPDKPALGGFYEIETSSPGAELAPGEALVHTQRTFHFEGIPQYVDELAGRALLGDARTRLR